MFTWAASNLHKEELTALLLALAVLLLLARVLGELAARLGQPSVLGELLAGILLGPTVLGAMSPAAYGFLFVDYTAAADALQALITMSVTLLLLTAGLEVELSTVWRQGRTMLLVSVMGLLLPLALGAGLGWALPALLGKPDDAALTPFALFVGISMSITALPIIAKILMDINLFRSDLGMLILSAAMVNDLIGWIGFAMVLAMIGGGGGGGGADHGLGVGLTIGLTLGFLVLMLTLGRVLIHRAIPLIQAHWSWPGGVISFTMVITLLCAAATEAIGIHAIFGAFIAGVAIGDSSHLRERTRETLHEFISNFFAPLFFASIGLHVNFIASFDPVLVLIVVVLAFVSKVGGSFLGARIGGLRKHEALAVGFGMSAMGTMGIVLGQIALENKLIKDPLYVAIVLLGLITSIVAGPAMQRVLGRKLKKTIASLLTSRHFVAQLRSTDARSVIAEMAGAAGAATGLDAQKIYEAVWSRERTMSTGLGSGIAVPHARLAALTQPTILIGRSPTGVDFNAADGVPARIICLLLTPENDQIAQIDLLRMVAETFSNTGRREKALAAASYAEFLAAIKLPVEQEKAEHGK
jgi:Kef-type K+ transport system membrane component KefB/mannitol/fructose-specific phosphotransferase system IIA component (Ntr-type)